MSEESSGNEEPSGMPEYSRRRADRSGRASQEHSSQGRSSEGMPSWRTALGEAGPYLGLGLQIALTMAFYVGAGLGLDFLIGTLPWLTILGALTGLATLLYHVVRVAGELGKKSEQKRKAQRGDEDRSKGV